MPFPLSALMDDLLFEDLLRQDLCSHQWNSLQLAQQNYHSIRSDISAAPIGLFQRRLSTLENGFRECVQNMTIGMAATLYGCCIAKCRPYRESGVHCMLH